MEITLRPASVLWNEKIEMRHSHSPNLAGEIAERLCSHIAMIAAVNNGEDSAGRAVARLLTPGEVAQRACNIAENLVSEFEERRWLVEVPLKIDRNEKQ